MHTGNTTLYGCQLTSKMGMATSLIAH